MNHPYYHAYAYGGAVAAKEALSLWAQCAIGGAAKVDTTSYDAAVAALVAAWHDEDAAKAALVDMAAAAAALRAEVMEIEGGNSSMSHVKSDDYGVLVLGWTGTFTRGREILVEIFTTLPSDLGSLMTRLQWNTATGRESGFLKLPSSTDEVDLPDGQRRVGGWYYREAIDTPPDPDHGRLEPGAGQNGLPGWISAG